MRKQTVRSGLRLIAAGILCLIAVSFFSFELARLLFLGIDGEARLTLVGFLAGGVCGGCGVVVAAAGLLQSESREARVRLLPTLMLLFSLVVLFFFLTYNSIQAPPTRTLPPGESVDI